MPISPALLKQIETNNAAVRRGGGTPPPTLAQLDASAIAYLDPDTPLYADPSLLGWPPALPLELALGQSSVKEICDAHGISRDRWDQLRNMPSFRQACEDAVELLKKDGMSFRIKARMMGEALLPTLYKMIHDRDTADNVKADLAKFVIKAAGLSEEKAETNGVVGTALQININMG